MANDQRQPERLREQRICLTAEMWWLEAEIDTVRYQIRDIKRRPAARNGKPQKEKRQHE